MGIEQSYSNEIKDKAVILYDIIDKVSYKIKEANNNFTPEQARCIALAKTKLQECLMWVNTALKYGLNPDEVKDIEQIKE